MPRPVNASGVELPEEVPVDEGLLTAAAGTLVVVVVAAVVVVVVVLAVAEPVTVMVQVHAELLTARLKVPESV